MKLSISLLKFKIISTCPIQLCLDEWASMLKNLNGEKPTDLFGRIDYIQTQPTSLLKRHRAVTRFLQDAYDNLIKLEQDIRNLDPSDYDEYVVLEEIIMDLFEELMDSKLMLPLGFPFNKNSFQEKKWIFSNHFHISVLSLFEHYKLNYPIINTQRLKELFEKMLSNSLLSGVYQAPCFNSKINKLLSINYFFMPRSISRVIHSKIDRIAQNMKSPGYYQSESQLADIRFLRHCIKSFYFLKESSSEDLFPKDLAREWDEIYRDKRSTETGLLSINEYFISRQESFIRLLKHIFI